MDVLRLECAALADPAVGFGGGQLGEVDPSQGTPKTKNSSDLAHYFLGGVAQNHLQK